jgi:hypothetical protein
MAKPRLNKKQRRWLNNFKSQYPWYKVREIRADLDGDRIVVLVGTEQLPLPLIPEFAGVLPGYRLNTLETKLRKYGDPRDSAKHSYTTVYPHCNISEKQKNTSPTGQLCLPIPASVLEIPQAINPVVVTWKPKQKAKPKLGIQLSLPVTGLEAKVFGLRQEKRPHLPPVSAQELLAEKVTTWSQRDRKEVELPQVMVDLLQDQGADHEEWQSAIDLFGVIGLPGAMSYLEGIPYLRKSKGKPVSTAAASAAVPVVTKAKSSSVPVKAFG